MPNPSTLAREHPGCESCGYQGELFLNGFCRRCNAERQKEPPKSLTAAWYAGELYRLRAVLLEDELCRPEGNVCGRRTVDAAVETIRALRARVRNG